MSTRSRSQPWFRTPGERYTVECCEADRKMRAELDEPRPCLALAIAPDGSLSVLSVTLARVFLGAVGTTA